jgi:hypothetical protein
MNERWKKRKGTKWNAVHCNSPIWIEAIRNNWNITLALTSADGSYMSFSARCQ